MDRPVFKVVIFSECVVLISGIGMAPPSGMGGSETSEYSAKVINFMDELTAITSDYHFEPAIKVVSMKAYMEKRATEIKKAKLVKLMKEQMEIQKLEDTLKKNSECNEEMAKLFAQYKELNQQKADEIPWDFFSGNPSKDMEERFLALVRLAIKYHVTEIYFSNSYYYSEIETKVDGIYRKVKSRLEDGQIVSYLKHLAGLDADDTDRRSAVFAEDIDGILRYFRFTSFLYHGYPRAILEILP